VLVAESSTYQRVMLMCVFVFVFVQGLFRSTKRVCTLYIRPSELRVRQAFAALSLSAVI